MFNSPKKASFQTKIFASQAKLYRDLGLEPRPIEPGTKACFVPQWTQVGPAAQDDVFESWRREYSNHGIGLLMGTKLPDGTYLAALDIDRDDYVRLASVLLNDPPCGRIGSKGVAIFVRVKGEIASTAFHRGGSADGDNHVGDWLGKGKLCVIPPTIHPDTDRPYEWTNTPLHEMEMGKLPLVNANFSGFKLIEAALESEHVPTLMTGEQTHDAALRYVGQLVQYTDNKEQIIRIVRAALPENYAGDTLKELPGMIDGALKKGYFGGQTDREDSNPPSQSAIPANDNQEVRRGTEKSELDRFTDDLVQRLDLFHDEKNDAYAAVETEAGGVRTFLVDSCEFNHWIQREFYKDKGRALSNSRMETVVNVISAKAKFDGPRCQVFLRYAAIEDRIYCDLGDEAGRVVEIAPGRWQILTRSPVYFIRPNGMKPLPIPSRGGNLEELRKLLRLDGWAWILFLAFVLSAMRGRGPYFCLFVEAEQGSGKSFLCSIIKKIVDPSDADRVQVPKNTSDLMIYAKSMALLSFDNVSYVKADTSDALCNLATGGSIVSRQLYTNDGLHTINVARPFVINGIGDFADRPDLLDRAISLQLPAIRDNDRLTESELLQEFELIMPGVLGSLFDILAHALKFEEKVEVPKGIRMADCMRFLVAAERACGFDVGTFEHAIRMSQTETIKAILGNDDLVERLRRVVEKKPFEDTVGKLHVRLSPNFSEDRVNLPKTAKGLSSKLRRLSRDLESVGIRVTFLERNRDGRMVRVELIPADDDQDRSQET